MRQDVVEEGFRGQTISAALKSAMTAFGSRDVSRYQSSSTFKLADSSSMQAAELDRHIRQ